MPRKPRCNQGQVYVGVVFDNLAPFVAVLVLADARIEFDSVNSANFAVVSVLTD